MSSWSSVARQLRHILIEIGPHDVLTLCITKHALLARDVYMRFDTQLYLLYVIHALHDWCTRFKGPATLYDLGHVGLCGSQTQSQPISILALPHVLHNADICRAYRSVRTTQFK